MSGAWLGLDVGGTNVRLAVWEGGAELPATVASAPLPADYAGFVALAEEMVGPHQAAAVGVGLPGVAFDQHVSWLPNVSFLEGDRLARDLGAMCAAPVFCANDAHTALLGEARFGAARGTEVALLISVGTGVGGAVLIGGRLFRGASGSAGSFGWVNLGLEDVWHPEHGQLELTASGTALAEQARGLDLTARELVAAARAGEEKAAAVIRLFARRLGTALATLVSVFDPQVVLLSGGLSAEFDLLAPGIHGAVQRHASPSGKAVAIRAASLGPEAGAAGAAVLGRAGRAAFL